MPRRGRCQQPRLAASRSAVSRGSGDRLESQQRVIPPSVLAGELDA